MSDKKKKVKLIASSIDGKSKYPVEYDWELAEKVLAKGFHTLDKAEKLEFKDGKLIVKN